MAALACAVVDGAAPVTALTERLTERLLEEAALCRRVTADDIANLLEEAALEIARLESLVESDACRLARPAPSMGER